MSFWSDIGNAISGIFGGKKETQKTTTTPPTTKGTVVTDFNSGESVQTNTSNGSITSQKYTPSPTPKSPRHHSGGGGGSGRGTITVSKQEVDKNYSNQNIGKQNALALANREGGLVEQSTAKPPSNEGTLQAQLNKVKASGTGYEITKTNNKINPNAPTGYAIGTLVVTPKEAKKLKNSGVAYWELSQTSNFNSALDEARFAQNVPYISKPYSTTGKYQTNLANIYAGQEAYRQYKTISTDFQANPEKYANKYSNDVKVINTTKGTTYSLQPSFWDKNINFSGIKANAQQKATQSFNNLPQKTQVKLQFQDFIVGGVMAGVSQVTYGMRDLGIKATQDKFKLDKNGNPIKKTATKYSFEKTYGDYPVSPTWVNFKGAQGINTAVVGRGLVLLPPLAETGVTAVKNIKALGLSEGTAQTLANFSPLRIKEGVYAEPLNADTKFKVKSFKYTNEKGITTETYKGKSIGGGTRVAGYSVSNKGVTSGFTITEQHTIEIRAGGSIVETGIKTTYSPYTSRPSGIGTGYAVKGNSFLTQRFIGNNFQAGSSKVISSKGFTIYENPTRTTYTSNFNKGYSYRTGSISEAEKNGVTNFISGKANAKYETTFNKELDLNTGQYSKDFIRSPTGKYRVNPKVVGKQYNLNKIFSSNNEGNLNKIFSSNNEGNLNKIFSSNNEGVTKFKGEGSGGGSSKVLYGENKLILNLPETPAFQTAVKVQTPKLEGVGAVDFGVSGSIRTKLNKKTILKNEFSELRTQRQNLNKNYSPQINVVLPDLKTKSKTKKSQRRIVKVSLVSLGAIKEANALGIGKSSRFKYEKGQAQKIRYVHLQKPSFETPLIPSPTFSYGFGEDYNPPTSFPSIDFPNGFRGGLGIGRTKVKKTNTTYTPSFTALFFKIKGKKKKGNKTGLDFRPITPNFSYQKRVKRLVKIKI